jgi:hypothetical protein
MTVCCPSKSLFLPLALLLGAGALALGASSFSAPKQDPKPPPEKPKDGPGGEKPREGGRGWGRGSEKDTPLPSLELAMQTMNGAIKALGKELEAKDPNAWAHVAKFEYGVAAAKLQVPETVSNLPESERAAALATYHGMLAYLLEAGCKLEREVAAGKWDVATKTFNESIKPMKERGHEKFNPKKK